MERAKNSRIRDIVAEKYGFDVPPSPEGPLFIMNEELTIDELVEGQKSITEQNLEIGVNLEKALPLLVLAKRISLGAVFWCHYSWLVFLLLSIGFLFVSKILTVIFAIVAIKEFFHPFMRGRLYYKIHRLAQTDYESFYMLLCTRSISIRPTVNFEEKEQS